MAKNVTGSATIPYNVSETETINISFDKPFRKINIMECLEEKLGGPLPDLESKDLHLNEHARSVSDIVLEADRYCLRMSFILHS